MFRPHGFRTWRGFMVMAVAVTVGAASGCAEPETAVPPPPPVTVDAPIRREVRPTAEFTGTTRAIASTEIRARVSGILQSVEFDPSSQVKKGDLLFVIEREPYKAALDQAEASVKSAQAQLAQATSDLKRIEQAIQSRAVSEQDLDAARAQLLRAEATLLSAQAAQERAALDYSYTLVRSPIDGQVSRNLVDPGNLVGASERTLLTTVNQMQPIYVYFEAPERLVLEFLSMAAREDSTDAITAAETETRRAAAFVKLSNETEFGHPGHVDYIDNTVNPNTGTIQLRVVCPNDDLTMFPGLFVRVRLLAPTSQEAILVSERGVGTDLGGKYVMILDEQNVVEQRYVSLGQPQDDGTVVVTSGLDGSERYIVNGLLRARPGLPVQPMPAEAGGAK